MSMLSSNTKAFVKKEVYGLKQKTKKTKSPFKHGPSKKKGYK